MQHATACSRTISKEQRVRDIQLPKADLFNQGQRWLAQLSQSCQRDLRSAERLSLYEGRISLDIWVQGIFLVQIGEQLLTSLCNEKFDEKLGGLEMFG